MKKMIAPIIFSIIGVVLMGAYVWLIASSFRHVVAYSIGGCVIIALIIAMAVVLRQRIKEIKQEEKDDISQY